VLIPTYQGIGLHLNYSGVINYIEPGSPAQIAGLNKNQRIVEVNNINVRGKTNREIAEIIKENIKNLTVAVEPAQQSKLPSTPSSPITSTDTDPEKESTLAKLIASGTATATPIARPITDQSLLAKQTKATSESALNEATLSPAASVSNKIGKSIAGKFCLIIFFVQLKKFAILSMFRGIFDSCEIKTNYFP
jgi:membrane-associated protease RseP (regulator of RpoE activity)